MCGIASRGALFKASVKHIPVKHIPKYRDLCSIDDKGNKNLIKLMTPQNVKVKAIHDSENDYKEHREYLEKCGDPSKLMDLQKKKDFNIPTISANVMPDNISRK